MKSLHWRTPYGAELNLPVQPGDAHVGRGGRLLIPTLQAVSEQRRTRPVPGLLGSVPTAGTAWLDHCGGGGGWAQCELLAGTSSLACVGGSAHWLVFRARGDGVC